MGHCKIKGKLKDQIVQDVHAGQPLLLFGVDTDLTLWLGKDMQQLAVQKRMDFQGRKGKFQSSGPVLVYKLPDCPQYICV